MNKHHQHKWQKILNTTEHWGWAAIAFHWVTAIIVFSLFILGLWMVELDYYHSWYKTAPELHKSTGIMLLILTILRLLWRVFDSPPQPIVSHTPRTIRLAQRMHKLLYILLFCVMFSGYLISTADGRGVALFGLFEIPAVISGYDNQEDIAGIIHLVLALCLITLVLLHATAAVKHHIIDRDRTLKRMLGY